MTDHSSRRIHLGKNSKRSVANLTPERLADFKKALERMASNPEPDGRSKVAIHWFPEPGLIAYSALEFLMKYKIVEDGGIYVAAVYDRRK